MGKTYLPPGGGALPARPDGKMSAEHPRVWYQNVKVPYRAWAKMLKHSAAKKRRQRDRLLEDD